MRRVYEVRGDDTKEPDSNLILPPGIYPVKQHHMNIALMIRLRYKVTDT